MTQLFSNNASTTLSSALTAIATSMSVVTGDGALFESPTGGNYELITLTDGTNIEIVKTTARSTDTLTIVRAQEGTTAQAWAAGTVAQGRLTAATLDQFPQLDNGGNAKGVGAVNLQSGRSAVTSVASGTGSIVVGAETKASADYAIAIGYASLATEINALSMGNDSLAAGGNDIAIGRSAGSFADGSIAIGYGSWAVSVGSTAVGHSAWAQASHSVAIGYNADSRIVGGYVITGLSLIRKDNAEAATDEHLYFTGSEAVVFSKEIDLTAAAADDVATITIPTGATFYPNEIGLIVTAANTVTVQPSVSFGMTGDTVALLASTATTKSAIKGRDIFTLLSRDGVNSLTASVKAAATATALTGRFYWRGILVEDQ